MFSLLITPRLLLRWGGRPVLLAGLALIAAGLAVLARVPPDARLLVDVLPATLAMGAGGGLTLPALASLGMSTATDRNAGLASGLLNTTQQVGGALGLAILTSLAAARTAGSIQSGGSSAAALTDGYRLGFGVGAVIVVAALILAALACDPVRPLRSTPLPGADQRPEHGADLHPDRDSHDGGHHPDQQRLPGILPAGGGDLGDRDQAQASRGPAARTPAGRSPPPASGDASPPGTAGWAA